MSNKPKDYQAFPVASSDHNLYHSGLTKRELIAAKAMQGLLANPEIIGETSENVATTAVIHADALLAELAKV